jgi:hypothetical protein
VLIFVRVKFSALWAGLVLSLAACGGRARQDAAPAASSSAGAAGSGGGSARVDAGARVPKKHRASAAACPSARGTSDTSPLAPECPLDGGLLDCTSDTDCSDGTNGRCFRERSDCETGCSYDACSVDSDCGGTAPCECRASAADVAANRCETGSACRVDSDCGNNGYCSPSLLDELCFCLSTALCGSDSHCYAGSTEVPCSCGDSCGHGYFCHTPSDTCIDDSDCDGGACDYDQLAQRWQCEACLPAP